MNPREYRFSIDGNYTSRSIPMSRLAEYMQQLAALLGHRSSVHFSRIEDGSAILVSEVEPQDERKVLDRVRATQKHSGPKDSADAYEAIDKLLRDDNAVGAIFEPDGSKVITFPGRDKRQYNVVGPISEHGTIDGTPIQIGGRNDPCRVHLEDIDGTINICEIKRSDAKLMREYLYERVVRVSGVGRWQRDADGHWVLRNFKIHSFKALRSDGVQSTLDRLKDAYAHSDWAKSDDPLSDLTAARRENDT